MLKVKLSSSIIISFSIVTILSLTGCMRTAEVFSSSPRSVVIKNSSPGDASQTLADQECRRNDRYAIHRPDNQRDGFATYECVK